MKDREMTREEQKRAYKKQKRQTKQKNPNNVRVSQKGNGEKFRKKGARKEQKIKKKWCL